MSTKLTYILISELWLHKTDKIRQAAIIVWVRNRSRIVTVRKYIRTGKSRTETNGNVEYSLEIKEIKQFPK